MTPGTPIPPAPGTAGATAPAQSSADQMVQLAGDSFGSIRGVFAGADYDETAPVEHEYGLSAKELLFSAISGDHGIIIAAILLGGLSQVDSLLSVFGLNHFVADTVAYAITNYAIPLVIGIIVVTLVIVYVLSILGTVVQYGGFKARRRGGRIEVEMGLLSRQYKGVSVSRVQSVEIKQGAIRRLLGYAQVRLLTVEALNTNQNQQGGQAAQTNGLTIHPFIKLAAVEALLDAMIPEYFERCSEAELLKLPKVARRRVIIRHTVIFALVFALFAAAATVVLSLETAISINSLPFELASGWLVTSIWILFALLTVGRFIGALLWYRHAAYAYNDRMLTLRSGYFSVTTTIIPKRRIQWAQTKQNPFQRFANVASIQAVTAAGVGGTKTTLRDLLEDEANAYLDWVRPKTTKTPASKA